MKTPKTIRGLASAIAKREGKKSQARIGDLREVLGILSDLMFAEATKKCGTKFLVEPAGGWLSALVNNGRRRAKRKKK